MLNCRDHKLRHSKWIAVAALAISFFPVQSFGQRGENLRVGNTATGSFGGVTTAIPRVGQGLVGNFSVGVTNARSSVASNFPAGVPDRFSSDFTRSNPGGDLIRLANDNFSSSRFGRLVPVQDAGLANRIRLAIPVGPGQRYVPPDAIERLVRRTGFTAPIFWSEVSLTQVRDGLVDPNALNLPRYGPSFKHRTVSEVLKARGATTKGKAMADAWSWFSKRQFTRARAKFRSAELLDQLDPETRVGQFFCAIAEGKFSLATHDMSRILARDQDENLFAKSFDIPGRFASTADESSPDPSGPVSLGRRLNEFSAVARSSDIDLETMAALSYAFWHSERDSLRLEALRTAESIRDNDPTGKFVRVNELLQEAYDQRSAGGS